MFPVRVYIFINYLEFNIVYSASLIFCSVLYKWLEFLYCYRVVSRRRAYPLS